MGELEVEPEAALAEIVEALPRLLEIAEPPASAAGVSCQRLWDQRNRTFTYHTCAVVPEAPPSLLDDVSSTFLHANRLERQPWYDAFLGGDSRPWPGPLPKAVAHARLGKARFDFGLRRDRFYSQLIALLRPGPDVRVVALRSVPAADAKPPDAVLAYTLTPTADVFVRADGALRWHHIVTVNGAALLRPTLDRWMMNTLRFLRLDQAERRTYLAEAHGFIAFCGSGAASDLARSLEGEPSDP